MENFILTLLHYLFDLTSFYRLGQQYKNIFVHFLVQMKILKSLFEINLPLMQVLIKLDFWTPCRLKIECCPILEYWRKFSNFWIKTPAALRDHLYITLPFVGGRGLENGIFCLYSVHKICYVGRPKGDPKTLKMC